MEERTTLYTKINKYLSKYLSEKRKNHSLSAAAFMTEYSHFFNLDQEDAYLAGLSHDICKEMGDSKIVRLSKSFIKRELFPIKYFDFKVNYPNLLHGVAAAELLVTKFKVDNIDILNAICSHTLGGPNLCVLSKYTFVCDFCEPTRKNPNSKKVRKTITKEQNLDKAFFQTNRMLLAKLTEKGTQICMETVEGYNDSLRMLGKH